MITAWILSLHWPDIMKASEKWGLDYKVVAAVVMQESAGKACATRYEDHYRWTFDLEKYAKLNSITKETEEIQQKTSWGLMQIMGGVARELGFTGDLVRLCEPKLNLRYGIKKIKQLIKKHDDFSDAIASYNAGSPRKDESGNYVNQHYVNSVMRYMDDL